MSDEKSPENLIQQYGDGDNASGDDHGQKSSDGNNSSVHSGDEQDSTDSNATQVAANVSPEVATAGKGKKPARGRTTRGRVTRVAQGRKKHKEDDAAVHWKKTDVDAMMTNLQQDAKKREDDLRRQANSWKKELDKAYKAIDDTEERMNLTARQREVQLFEDAQRREDALKKDARDKEETLKQEMKDKEDRFIAVDAAEK